jgi:hypothetical protein
VTGVPYPVTPETRGIKAWKPGLLATLGAGRQRGASGVRAPICGPNTEHRGLAVERIACD